MFYYVNDSNDYGNICLKINCLGSYTLKKSVKNLTKEFGSLGVKL